MGTYKDLDVWKMSMELAVKFYQKFSKFPEDEKYNLRSQMARAVVSIPSNIAEGASRKSPHEKTHYLEIALGSLNELETQYLICQNIKILEDISLLDEMDLLRRKLVNFKKYQESLCQKKIKHLPNKS